MGDMPFRIPPFAPARLSHSLPRLLLALAAAIAPAGTLWSQMEHQLFITSVTYNINADAEPNPAGDEFGGLLSADYHCTLRANEAGLIQNWNGIDRIQKALISSSTENANERMEIIGRVANMHGEVLANNQADLWDGTIATGVNYDEFGNLVPNNTNFWTGSNSVGEASQNALNWTSASSGQTANVGLSHSTINWFNKGELSASGSRHMPCLCEARVIDPGDFNDDGLVNAADYTVWRDTLGIEVDRGYFADGDGDGTITLDDYTVWVEHFGINYLAGSGAAIVTPEPSACMLVFIGFGWFIAGRRI